MQSTRLLFRRAVSQPGIIVILSILFISIRVRAVKTLNNSHQAAVYDVSRGRSLESDDRMIQMLLHELVMRQGS